MRTAFVAVIVVAVVGVVAELRATEVVSSEAAFAPRVGCENCGQQQLQPPWHRNVRPPSHWGCQQGCRPECESCQEVECYRLPPCFPRLHALFCEGYLLSPTPPRPPRCPQCGCHIPDGF